MPQKPKIKPENGSPSKNYQELKVRHEKLQKEYDELVKSHKKLDERIIDLYMLYNISRTLNSTLDMDKLFEIIISLFRESFKIDQYAIVLLDEEFDRLDLKLSFGISEKGKERFSMSSHQEIAADVIKGGKQIYVRDISEEKKYKFFLGEKKTTGAFLSVPLVIEEEQVIGAINFHKPTPDSFTLKEQEQLKYVADEIAVAVQKADVFQKTVEISIKDELTKIYNRRYFNSRFDKEIVRSRRYKRPISVIMVDVDHFKTFNDTNGHQGGDEVLKKVASTLKQQTRSCDILARYGGEEFVILLTETEKTSAVEAAEKFRKAIHDKKFKGEETQPNGRVSISLGVANYPADADDPFALIEYADKCLYMAKFSGRDRVCSSFEGKEKPQATKKRPEDA